MAYTISTHNGSAVSRQHNLRNPKVVDKQEHIRKNGIHETWIDVDPRKAYRELFGAAQDAYNQKQLAAGRPGRCIKSYYDAVKNDAKKHPVYEMIVSIGNKQNPPPPEVAKEIMREFVDSWPIHNDSLKMIGAYYHADEQGIGHVHIDYVPVAHGYRNGMEVQNGLVKALNEIGFETRSSRDTAQIEWEAFQNYRLEQICKWHGLEVEHPLIEGRKHLETERYKAEASLKETQERLHSTEERLHSTKNRLQSTEKSLEEAEAARDELTANIEKMHRSGREKFNQYQAALQQQKAAINQNNATIERQGDVIGHNNAVLEMMSHEIKNHRAILQVFGEDPDKLIERELPKYLEKSSLEEPDLDDTLR